MKRKWQDIVLMVGNFVLSASLLPSVFSTAKPALLTSLLTGIILVSFAIVFASLKLKLSTIAVSITAFLWFVLLVQVMV